MKANKLLVFILLVLLAAGSLAQAPSAEQQPPAPPASTQRGQSAPSPTDQKNAPTPTQPPPQTKQQQAEEAEPEHRITKQEAEELFQSVDQILKFQSGDTDLPMKHRVKRKMTSRDEVEKYFLDRFKDDEQAKRLNRSELVLKKFGLVPRDFYLEGFMLELLREQVAGYYDSKTKTVYLLDWIDPEAQKPVLAHELTHALQDQNFGLEKWMKEGPTSKNKQQNEIESDEDLAAREAIVEGQAMIAMIDYMLAPTGQSAVTAPNIVHAMQAGMGSGGGSPVFDHAPLYLKESLIFPYTWGADFVLKLRAKGKDAAFADVFKNPPRDTRHIMQPELYMAGDKTTPLPVPDFGAVLGRDWDRFDIGSVGEFDIDIMAQQYGMKQQDAEALARGWRGGYYYSAAKHGLKNPTIADVCFTFVTRWGSEEEARNFINMYSASVRKRYKQASAGDKTGEWTTEEGRVTIQPYGNLVVVNESFDPALSARLTGAALSLDLPDGTSTATAKAVGR